MKNILVLASGGFDSTFLIYKNLKEGHKVTPLYISTFIDDIQKELEKKALYTIDAYFKFKYSKNYSSREFCDMTLEIPYASEICLQQPLVWIFGAYLFVQNNTKFKSFDEIQIAYVMEDHALSYLNELRSLYNSLNKFIIVRPDEEINIPKLSFPLIKHNKSYIFAMIASELPELYNVLHFCENPHKINKTRCNECHSCKVANEWGYESFKSTVNANLNSLQLKTFSAQEHIKAFPYKEEIVKSIEKKIGKSIGKKIGKKIEKDTEKEN
jgi:7-cyano-7-deazaguanine synthase in queuosine biosynthesis